MTASAPPGEPRSRTTRDLRREELLDAAAHLLEEGGISAVTMDAVASAAGVSRPLVYKHFANRDELVAELWRRESSYIDREVLQALDGVTGFEAMVRTSVETILDVLTRRGRNYAPLLRGQVFAPQVRDEQVARSRRTRAWYAQLVVDEFGIARADAEVAIAVYFAGLDSMLAEWRPDARRADHEHVVDLYVELVVGGLRALAARSRS